VAFINPATGHQFGEICMSTEEEVRGAVQELRSSSKAWGAMTVRERVRILRRFQKVMIASLDEITDVINQDCGKSRQDALIEVFVTLDMLEQYCRSAEKWLRPRSVSRGLYLFKRCHVEYRPYGVVGVIAPWNYPFALSMPPALAALLAGNTVILKPSEVTAASGVMIEKLFQRVPELAPYVRVVHGDGAVGEALVRSAPDYIFLTGSGPTGRKVMKAAADYLIPVACELGGKEQPRTGGHGGRISTPARPACRLSASTCTRRSTMSSCAWRCKRRRRCGRVILATWRALITWAR